MKFGFIGGDMRNQYLASILKKQGNDVYVYADLDIYKLDKQIKVKMNIDDVINNSDIIVLPIPLSRDGNIINTPFLNEEITIKELANKIKEKTIVSGNISDKIYKIFDNNHNKIIDIMDFESFAIYNAIATAEGTISLMIENSASNIHMSKVLILGFGKCGKLIADKLKSMKAKVSVTARNEKDLAFIECYGYEAIRYNSLDSKISEFDFIINTISSEILSCKAFDSISKECLIIDISSNPGGINKQKCSMKEIKLIHALGIPGKVSPKSSGQIIEKLLSKVL